MEEKQPSLKHIEPTPERKGVIGIVIDRDRLLVIRRSKSVIAPGYYCFPGGGIETGETEPEALRREFLEELALEVEPIEPIWQYTTPWQVQLSWWLAERVGSQKLIANPEEVESIHWLTLTEIEKLDDRGLPSNRAFLDAICRGDIRLPLS
jgi:8-oxo-dGTP diphosphatase